jgi:acyl-coenzyme A thioesterase PaaI-like protein
VDDRTAAPKIEYGVTPTHVMASMPGLDFVRAIFDGRLPAPPIMQNVEPFDSTAEIGHVVFHSVPGFRHYNPIGSVHGGYAAILLDSAMGLAVHSALPAGTGYTTLEFKISFIKAMTRIPALCAARARRSASAAAPPPQKRASPTPRAGCSRMRRRRVWFSRFQREREQRTAVLSCTVGKAKRAHPCLRSADGGHGAGAPLPTLRFHYDFNDCGDSHVRRQRRCRTAHFHLCR